MKRYKPKKDDNKVETKLFAAHFPVDKIQKIDVACQDAGISRTDMIRQAVALWFAEYTEFDYNFLDNLIETYRLEYGLIQREDPYLEREAFIEEKCQSLSERGISDEILDELRSKV